MIFMVLFIKKNQVIPPSNLEVNPQGRKNNTKTRKNIVLCR